MSWLKGKKTVLGSVAGGALVIAHALGWVDTQMAEMIGAAILAWTGISLRMAVAKGK